MFWDGTIATTPNADGVTESEVPWCFAYGEQEWVSGKKWRDVKQAASDTDARGNIHNPVGRMNCN